MLKLAIILGVYIYSALIRDFREKSNNFSDSPAFAKVLDGMIKKLK
jgi:ubiquinone biosynthesis protein COQ9